MILIAVEAPAAGILSPPYLVNSFDGVKTNKVTKGITDKLH